MSFCHRNRPIHYVSLLNVYDGTTCSSSADAGNNACGLGFNGYDSNGRELWNRITNVNVLEVEVSLDYMSFLLKISVSNDERKKELLSKGQSYNIVTLAGQGVQQSLRIF